MTIEQLLESCPEYAKDLKLNLGSVLRQAELTEQQTWGTAVCSAMASRNSQVIDAILGEAAAHLNPQALYAAKAAAAVMGMNNIFYRFRHLSGNEKYSSMPARLRMQVIRTHGSDPVDFELWCLCGLSHSRLRRLRRVPREGAARKRSQRRSHSRCRPNRFDHSRVVVCNGSGVGRRLRVQPVVH